MSSTYKYFKLTIKHKWFVFLAGLKVGCPIWRLIKHDWTKFLPSELSYYGNQFFGKADNPQGFIKCWLHHQNMNDHHWEYYIPRTGHNRCNPPYPDNEPIDMTDDAIKEMVADWLGASRAYEGKWPTKGDWKWFDNNFDRIRVTSTTKIIIQNILDVYFKNN
jgi:hypothetical protein